jgi:hypothetical protein
MSHESVLFMVRRQEPFPDGLDKLDDQAGKDSCLRIQLEAKQKKESKQLTGK